MLSAPALHQGHECSPLSQHEAGMCRLESTRSLLKLSCPAGDGVEQLLWRIQHGEVPGQGQHHPKVVVVHVGTNGEPPDAPGLAMGRAYCLESYQESCLWKATGRRENSIRSCHVSLAARHGCSDCLGSANLCVVLHLTDIICLPMPYAPKVAAQEGVFLSRRQPAEADGCCADIAGDCSVETAEKVAGQMEKLLEEMHRRLPNTHIIVMAILPKVLRLSRLPY